MNSELLCENRSIYFKYFIEEIFNLGFKDTPNYDHLVYLLQEAIKDETLNYSETQYKPDTRIPQNILITDKNVEYDPTSIYPTLINHKMNEDLVI